MGGGAASGGGLHGLSNITSKEGLEEVSLRIRGAMKERGKRRRKSEEIGGFDGMGMTMGGEGVSGSATPGSEGGEGRKDL